ncbi:flagellar hook assembly protein FlgD [Bacillus lacus]|uniref:Flagellar hook assembly protein FlgD n=2 Tax=Metabacillus lacus TaxID=1983721 RepID=A0A7X2LXC8_9BACI|nr:flagellar hook assembly protein FlgD [Metabacillus lacus]MRX70598.1 flagellar hook assembly protein FlgD [Metabacillus lacus]
MTDISIDPSLMLSSTASQRNTGSSTLGKDDFLKILITQLRNQDPLKPMEDKEFISQMANFSSLEQMTNMNRSLEQFLQFQKGNSLLQYADLIGKEVEWDDPAQQNLKNNGTVAAVLMQSGSAVLELSDGTRIDALSVKKLSSSPGSETTK